MMGLIAGLTFRELAGPRRLLALALLSLLPVAVALAFRAGHGPEDDVNEFAARVLIGGLIVAGILPITASVFGTAAMGAELDDGTAPFLLAKPIARWVIVIAKALAAGVLVFILVVPAAVVAVVVATGEADLVPAVAVSLCAGAALYTAIFLAMSLYTSRALVAGLAYVFIWEGVVTSFFSGTRALSVRHYILGVADAIERGDAGFDAEIAAATAVAGLVAGSVGALYFATRRLERWEIDSSS